MPIGAIASVIGGIMGRNSERKAIAAQNAYNAPDAIRARAEKAGFNPLLFIGPGVGQQTTTGGTNFLGAGIANAGLAIADTIDKNKMLEIERQKIAQDQRRLDALIQKQTLRPKVGGVYSTQISTPTMGGVGSPTAVKPVGSKPQLTYGIKPTMVNPDAPDFQPKSRNVTENIKTSGGRVLGIPIGNDLDEILSGAAYEYFGVDWGAEIRKRVPVLIDVPKAVRSAPARIRALERPIPPRIGSIPKEYQR